MPVGAEVISLLGLLEMSWRLSAVGKVRGGGRLSLNDASAILTRRDQPCAVPRRGGVGVGGGVGGGGSSLA